MGIERYARQTILPGIGSDGQKRLARARILCVGVGGLGSPAALYLAAAGVGLIGVIDDDRVDESNLQRQILFSTSQLGQSKASAAVARLTDLNPHIRVVGHDCRLDQANALELFSHYDVVIDGTDNFETKYLINDAAVRLGLPVVYGSLSQFEGRVAIFWALRGPCYRCLYPSPPLQKIANCAETGVLGALAGTIGSLQALEAIKLCLGEEFEALIGRLVILDGISLSFFEHRVPKNKDCPVCSLAPDQIKLPVNRNVCRVTKIQAQDLLLDVRSHAEWRSGHLPNARSWPLELLENGELPEFESSAKCVVYCQAGVRSRRAIEIMAQHGFNNIQELAGGLNAHKERGL